VTRVFLADNQSELRAALRLMLLDLGLEVVGEAADWTTTLAGAAGTRPDMVVVDWDMIPGDSSLAALRMTCPAAAVIVLINHLDARGQAALSAGADRFISKNEAPDRVAAWLSEAAARVRGSAPIRLEDKMNNNTVLDRSNFKTAADFLDWLDRRKADQRRTDEAEAACRSVMVWADDGGRHADGLPAECPLLAED